MEKNLITEINRTNNLKNDIHLGLNNIGDEIYRNGGKRPITIADVPSKISDLVSNYKKIAEINPGLELQGGSSLTKQLSIPLNLSFVPQRVFLFVQFWAHNYLRWEILDSDRDFGKVLRFSSYETLKMKSYSASSLELEYVAGASMTYKREVKVLAFG